MSGAGREAGDALGDTELEARFRSLNLEATLGAAGTHKATERVTFAARPAAITQPEPPLAVVDATTATVPQAPTVDALPRISLGPATTATLPTGGVAPGADLRVLQTLGEGGMGRVSLAEQRSLGRLVAVKTLKEGAGRAEQAALLSEAVVTGYLQHPGIVPIHVLGVDDHRRPVLVMKRVEGVEWSTLIHDDDAPAWSWEALHDDHLVAHLEIFKQVCNAVSFAHSQGIVHRDIKPENVMIGRYGEVYLLDWGISLRLTDDPAAHAGELVGTPCYMAPEMVIGGMVTPAADVYLLGAVLHEVLTKAPRHAGESVREVLVRAFESTPARYGEGVPSELAALAADATAREPGKRPAGAAEVRRRVQDFLRHRGSVALSDAAGACLLSLRAVLEARHGEWLADARKLATQARFGFTQALQQWPDNAAAVDGLAQTLAELVEMELAREDAVAARAALSDLDHPPAVLAERVARLERRVAERTAETERLRAMAAGLDSTVSRKERVFSMVLFLSAAAATAVVALQRGAHQGLTYDDVIRFGVLIVVALAVVMATMGKALFRNEHNRRLSATFILAAVSVVAHRFLLWRFEPPIPQVLLGDLLLASVAAAVGAATAVRWLWFPAALLASGSGAIVLWPDHALPVFAATMVVSLASCVFLLRRNG